MSNDWMKQAVEIFEYVLAAGHTANFTIKTESMSTKFNDFSLIVIDRLIYSRLILGSLNYLKDLNHFKEVKNPLGLKSLIKRPRRLNCIIEDEVLIHVTIAK